MRQADRLARSTVVHGTHRMIGRSRVRGEFGEALNYVFHQEAYTSARRARGAARAVRLRDAVFAPMSLAFQAMPAPQGQSFVIQAQDAQMQGGLEFNQYASYVGQKLSALGYTRADDPRSATLLVRLDYGVGNAREKVESYGGGWGGGWGPG